jgi:hypothetical protein
MIRKASLSALKPIDATDIDVDVDALNKMIESLDDISV